MTRFISTRRFSRRALVRASLPAAVTAFGLGATAPRAAQGQATPAAGGVVAATVDWLLGAINAGGAGLTDGTIERHLAPVYRTATPSGEIVPASVVREQLRRLGNALGEVSLLQFAGEPSAAQTIAIINTSAAGPHYLVVSMEEQAPNRIVDAFLLPVVATEAPAVPASWAELDRGLAAQAADVNFLAAEIVDGGIAPVHGFNADTPLGIGSSFKLYVLGELARQVAAGEAGWDEVLPLRRAWRGIASQASDAMAYEPDGTEHTLREYAAQMMAVSSNTATDHLIMRLGRERVEATMTAMGHADAAQTIPLLTTRELYVLQLVLPEERMQAYIAADTATRRQMLAAEIDTADVAPVQQLSWLTMRSLDPAVQWTASAADLGRALAALHRLAQQPELAPVLDILALESGIDPAAIGAAFPYVGFKGGTLPGVSNRSWLLKRADGRWFVVSSGLSDPHGRVDIEAPVYVLAAAFPLLAQAPAATPAV